MKKIFFSLVLAAIITVAVFNFSVSVGSRGELSDLTLANIKALGRNEDQHPADQDPYDSQIVCWIDDFTMGLSTQCLTGGLGCTPNCRSPFD